DGKLALRIGAQVCVPDRIPIDRRIIERRKVHRRLDVRGNDPAPRAMQRHAFGLGDRRNALADQPFHLFQTEQRSRKRKTVIAELCHHRLRVAAASATGTACLSKRSAMASMSLRSITGTLACGSGISEATATTCESSGWISDLPLAAR